MNELKFAFRSLLRDPGFTLIAVVTLTLGIGLNTAMFSFMNGLLLRPLQFPEAGQLSKLSRATPQIQYGGFSPADFGDLKRDEASFGRFAGYRQLGMTLADPGRPTEWQNALLVSADFFEVLGVQPQLGRVFRPDEEISGNHRVVLLSEALWQDRFGRATDVIGKTVRANGETYEIIGVLPATASDFRIFGPVGLFRPLALTGSERTDRRAQWLNILGRRDRSISAQQGEAFVTAFGARLAVDFPSEHGGSSWRSEGLGLAGMSPTGKAMIAMILGLSGFVLLIACSNLANIFLARALERNREMALRAALGASRRQLLRPLAWESLLLVTLGGVGALLVSAWTSRWLHSMIVISGGPAAEFPLDWRVLGFALAISALTLGFFVVAPAVVTLRVNTNDALKSGARGTTSGRGSQRLRHSLIVGQFALAMILLTGAGFFARGFAAALKQEHGWQSEGVVQGFVLLPDARYPGGGEITSFHQQAIERLTQLPGVVAASFSYSLPFLGLRDSCPYVVEGRETSALGRAAAAKLNAITPGYFSVTGTRLLDGRAFTDADSAGSLRIVIINQTMARTLFPNDNPVGRRVARFGANPPDWAEIVGVVADARSFDVAQSPAQMQIYHPLAQEPRHGGYFAVRTAGVAPTTVIEPIRSVLAAMDSELQLRDLMTTDVNMESLTTQMRLFGTLLVAFAALGVLLAAVGIYGVMAHSTAQRTGEFGVRMALGAQAADVTRLVLRGGLRIALLGTAIGLAGGVGFSRLLAAVLPSMDASGGLVMASATTLMALVALAACWLPARRAAKVDPMVALRTE